MGQAGSGALETTNRQPLLAGAPEHPCGQQPGRGPIQEGKRSGRPKHERIFMALFIPLPCGECFKEEVERKMELGF